MTGSSEVVSEAIGVFHSVECLESAVEDLQDAGFNRSELSLLAHDEVVEKKFGHVYKKAEDAADDPEAPRTAWVSRDSVEVGEAALVGAPLFVAALVAGGAVVATGGALLPAAGAALAAGGLAGTFGGLVAGEIGQEHATHYEQQLARGGILLWVHLRSPKDEQKAITILKKNQADHGRVHEIAASA